MNMAVSISPFVYMDLTDCFLVKVTSIMHKKHDNSVTSVQSCRVWFWGEKANSRLVWQNNISWYSTSCSFWLQFRLPCRVINFTVCCIVKI